MLIYAKFPSVCKACNRPILVGDRVSWFKGVQGAEHAACSDEGKRVATVHAESRATDADITVPVPPGLSYLPYQRAGIAYALNHSSTLIADEMGLGKTIQAIGVINGDESIRSVLIVCPASLKLNWRNECDRWLTRFSFINVWPRRCLTPSMTGPAYSTVRIQIINYDQLHKLPASDWDLLVADECHYAKNPKAKRTKLVQDVAKRCKRKVLLTGTPILNKPVELWPILQMVAPSTFDPPGMVKGERVGEGEGAGFFRFAKRYCDAKEVWHGRTKHWDFSGASNLSELQDKLRESCMVRRLKADVLAELPAKRRQIVVLDSSDIDLDNEQAAWHEAGLGDYESALFSLSSVRGIDFTEISKVRHETALQKVDACVEHIRNALEASEKIVVFAHHRDVIEAMAQGLAEYRSVSVTGETPVNERQAAVDAFQKDTSVRLFFGSIKAAGVGLTLTAASHVIFCELSWVPGDVTQAEDRCHRIGQKESVLIQHLVLDGSLDANMARLIVDKQSVADAALDDVTIDASVANRELASLGTRAMADDVVMPASERSRILAQLRYLASICDGAQEQDGMGFNGLDTDFGKKLASVEELTTKQALAAQRMLVKYQKQLKQGGLW